MGVNSNTGWNSGDTRVMPGLNKGIHHRNMARGLEILVVVILLLSCLVGQGLGNNTQNPVPDMNQDAPKDKIREINIRISGIKTDPKPWEAIVQNLLPFKPGDLYDLEKMEQAIARLSASNFFQSIHVPDPVKSDEGLKILLELVPYGRIKDIRIYNAFPLFHREVTNVMALFVGDVFPQDIQESIPGREKLDEQGKRVAALFKKQGFMDPKVVLTAERDETDGNYRIRVDIDKGEFFRVNQVEIQGNEHFSTARLKLRIQTWKASLLPGSGKRFVQKDLEDDVKNLMAFYREKGFAEVVVDTNVAKDEEGKIADLIFRIQEGPQYKIGFKGNEGIWDYTLKKEMTLAKEGNKNNFALRKSVRNLKKKYVSQGYPEVKILPQERETDPLKPDLKQVTMAIDEGYQYRVSKIEISGNQAVTDKEIFKSMLIKTPGVIRPGIYVAQTLDEDMSAIRAIYLKQGFTRTRVDKQVQILDLPESGKKKQKEVEIKLMIHEGVQTRVDQVRFDGISTLSPEAAMELISLGPGQPFREDMIKTDETSLKQKVSEQGYPHAQVTAAIQFSPDRSQVSLFYTIDPGVFVKVGQVFYAGNFRTDNQVLEAEMEISPDDPLSLTKLLESRRNLSDINALDSSRIKTIGLKRKAPEVDLIVEVEEKKPYAFEIGTGYDTERHLYLNSALGDQNFLGQNLDLQLEGEVSQIGYKGSLSLLEPRFLATRISSSTRLFGEDREEFNKEFGTRTAGVSQDFYQYFFSRKLLVNLGLMYEFRNQYLAGNQQPVLEEQDQYDPRHIVMASPGLVFQTTDSYVRPTQGSFSSLNMDVSKGIDNNLDDFIKYQAETRYYFSLADPLVLALRGRYGLIQPYGENRQVPEDQLFFLGGTSSVRGFDENLLVFDAAGQALGGRQILLGSVEARYDLGLNLEFTAFYDIGSVRKSQENVDFPGFRASVGAGLRYMTPIGPIGFLYGWKLDTMPGESPGSFHFSMGYTF